MSSMLETVHGVAWCVTCRPLLNEHSYRLTFFARSDQLGSTQEFGALGGFVILWLKKMKYFRRADQYLFTSKLTSMALCLFVSVSS